MRQLFTSPRLETVEGVAALLNEHGIETWISEARSYRGGRRREFSYRDSERADRGQADPSVWIVHTDDLTRARSLLREAGLLETTRGGDSYLPQGAGNATTTQRNPYRLAGKLRLGLLGGVAILAVLTLSRGCGTKPTPTPPVEERHIIVIDAS